VERVEEGGSLKERGRRRERRGVGEVGLRHAWGRDARRAYWEEGKDGEEEEQEEDADEEEGEEEEEEEEEEEVEKGNKTWRPICGLYPPTSICGSYIPPEGKARR